MNVNMYMAGNQRIDFIFTEQTLQSFGKQKVNISVKVNQLHLNTLKRNVKPCYFLIRLTQSKITLFTYQHYFITNAKIQSTNDIL